MTVDRSTLAAEAAGDGSNADLECRIAEVRRWFKGSVRNGREIEVAFRHAFQTMTSEEVEMFFDDFIRSWGIVISAANRRLEDAFAGAVAGGTRPTRRRGTRCS